MNKQVSANDDIDAACLWCVKCMQQVESEGRITNRRRKIHYRDHLQNKRLSRCNAGVYKHCKILINDICCLPRQGVSDLARVCVKSTCRQLMSRGERPYKKADHWLALRWQDSTTSLYLRDDTFIVLVSMPKSFDTVHETVRFAVGTTLILCVIFPLTKGLSSTCMRRQNSVHVWFFLFN